MLEFESWVCHYFFFMILCRQFNVYMLFLGGIFVGPLNVLSFGISFLMYHSLGLHDQHTENCIMWLES